MKYRLYQYGREICVVLYIDSKSPSNLSDFGTQSSVLFQYRLLCQQVAELTIYSLDCQQVAELTIYSLNCQQVAELTIYSLDCQQVAELTISSLNFLIICKVCQHLKKKNH